jgi:hypothetical protein
MIAPAMTVEIIQLTNVGALSTGVSFTVLFAVMLNALYPGNFLASMKLTI